MASLDGAEAQELLSPLLAAEDASAQPEPSCASFDEASTLSRLLFSSVQAIHTSTLDYNTSNLSFDDIFSCV